MRKTALALTLASILFGGAALTRSAQAGELSQSDGVVYVSCATQRNELVPEEYSREDRAGAIEYKDKVVLAHADYRVALMHCYNRPQSDYAIGIDLKTPTPMSEPVAVTIHGGSGHTLGEALDRLYGKTPESQVGFLYTLEARAFRHEKGLATKEMVSHQSFAHPLGIQVNRRAEIDRLVKEGQIRLSYR